MKLLATLLLAGISICALAQGTQTTGKASASLDITDINATILTGGDMFHTVPNFVGDVNYKPGFEVPRGSGKHTIFAGSLWIGGKDAGGQVYTASQMYRQPYLGAASQAGFWPGPIGRTQDLKHNSKYDKIWKVSKAEIQTHISNYFKRGYTIPPDIASWPGNGNIANGEAAQLAPYEDVNRDGIYSPDLGDYPLIKGDQALYLILNDKGNLKTPASPAMNIETHVMYYGFHTPNNIPLFNSLFCEYRLVNRGHVNFKDFYAGIWIDFDLGNYSDDYLGCDTLTNRFYAYNGDNYDEDLTYQFWDGSNHTTAHINGYLSAPPVQSVTFLDQKMSHFLYYNNDGNRINGNPVISSDIYNYLRAHWKDNSPLTYGGIGMNQQNRPVAYMWPGNPVLASGWSELNTLEVPKTNVPQDRRGVGSIGPFNLNAGQELKFTVVYTTTPNLGNLAVISCGFAAQDAETVKRYFNTMVAENAEIPKPQKETLLIGPNPATDYLRVQIPASFTGKPTQINLFDNVGRKIISTTARPGESSLILNLSSLAKGIYHVSVTSEAHTTSAKLVKQ